MPSPLPYYQWFSKDFAASTMVRRMSYAAKGIYRELLDIQWEEGSIDPDPQDIQEILGCSESEWSEFARFLDRAFPICEDGRRRNERMNEDREAAFAKGDKARRAIQKRWHGQEEQVEEQAQQAAPGVGNTPELVSERVGNTTEEQKREGSNTSVLRTNYYSDSDSDSDSDTLDKSKGGVGGGGDECPDPELKIQNVWRIWARLPASHQTPDVRNWLIQWAKRRSEDREAAFKQHGATLNANKLTAHRPNIAAEMLRASAENGWTGLFAPKGGPPASVPRPETTQKLTLAEAVAEYAESVESLEDIQESLADRGFAISMTDLAKRLGRTQP